MSEIIEHIKSYLQYFGGINPWSVILAVFLYILLHSNTVLGLLMRIASLWIVYNTYASFSEIGGVFVGIKAALCVAVFIFWPMAIKFIYKAIKKYKELEGEEN